MGTRSSHPESVARLRVQLQPLLLEDVQVTGKELGRGAYGAVYEVTVSGLPCAGKKLHEFLVQDGGDFIDKFSQECLLHSQQRHPNIVQLMGVHYPPNAQLPMLVMEYLPMSLTQCLDKHQKARQDLPLQIKNSILRDVAQGLNYLHRKRPPIIHRDLTANNVLLASNHMAKISDLGMSRMTDTYRHHQSHTLTMAPGNAIVMPPEALKDKSKYDHKLDVFSYGCLVLHVYSQQWPTPTDEYVPIATIEGAFRKVSEWERRSKYAAKIPKDNPFLQLSKLCLEDKPENRPEISGVLKAMDKETTELDRSLLLNKERQSSHAKTLEIQRLKKELFILHNKSPLSRADKIPRTEANYRVTDGNIAAIDFGTTSVSLAYIIKGDEKVVTLVLNEDDQSTRVPNAVLFKKEGLKMKVFAFGGNARNKFTKRIDEYSHIYFERIKMLMRREKTIDRETLVESFSGEKFYLVEVIAFILKYLKDLLLVHLSTKKMSTPKATDFDWVITVPAIWDARGKRMMREAAYLAGLLTESGGITQFTPVVPGRSLPLPNEANSERLSLALEPESAAFYSQDIVGKEIAGAGSAAAISRPSRYMVIDVGGGTVDITAHTEVNGSIQVENIPTGNAWGGTQINEAFSKMLQTIVSDPDFKSFLAFGDHSQQMAILNKILYKEFEGEKVLFGQLKNEEITIILPKEFVNFYEKVVEAGAKRMNGVEYDRSNDNLYIEKHVVESQLFGPALDGIIECTLSAIEENGCKVDTFYLVGGFGGCKYVHQKVSSAIEKLYSSKGRHCNVIVPPTPQLAVATGAAMWRKDPEKVKSRRADATYGISVINTFDPKKHDEHYRYYNEEQGKYKCESIFCVFLEKGEIASADEVITTSLRPSSQAKTQMTISIYSTPNLGVVQYTKDKNGKRIVTKIGELVIDVPNPDNLPREERLVDVTLDFSGTEIQAKAKYRVNGMEVKTVCDFLSAQIED